MTIRRILIAALSTFVFFTLWAGSDNASAAKSRKAAATCSGIPQICPPFQTANCVKGKWICRSVVPGAKK
jgi:hypothetical protein